MHLQFIAHLIVALCCIEVLCSGQAIVSLDPNTIYVEEGLQFGVPVRKSGVASEPFYVILVITNSSASSDFAGVSQVVEFPAGSGATTRNARFTTFDDELPEKDENFRVELRVQAPSHVAQAVEPTSSNIIINANDNAFGMFHFQTDGFLKVSESQFGPVPVVLTINRDGGAFEEVAVNYQVFNEDGRQNNVEADISPSRGTLIFSENEQNKLLTLHVQPDDVPENDETFYVTLTSASGGATISPVLNQTRVPVIISANDAPLRFSQPRVSVDELDLTHDIEIEVWRGLDNDESEIGPIQTGVTVLASVLSGTAEEGLDYIARNQSITFNSGVTRQKFHITILKDDIPEDTETFKVVLSNPGGDAVLTNPSEATVVIKANDDYNGILSFLSPVSGSRSLVVVDEDQDEMVDLNVVRGGGSYGDISVQWELVRNDSNRDPVSADLNPSSGHLTFLQGESQKVITIAVNQDSQPEEAERFLVRLVPETLTGGGRIEAPEEIGLIVMDSDNAYGLVEFGPDELQRLDTSTSPRSLQLMLVRSGGTFGEVSVSYTIQYFPTSDSMEPAENILVSPLAAALFLDGQSSIVLTLPIEKSAFLHVGGRFICNLTSISRAGDSQLSLSPMLGNRRNVFIHVTPALANGEIGFSSVEVRQVNEPDGPDPLQVELQLTREGKAGEALVHWQLEGTGDYASYVTAEDTGDTSGSVRIPSGSTIGFVVIEIQPDEVPETDEELLVTLTSVEPENQKLRETARQLRIMISENDSPGGTFQFSPSMNKNYILQEGGQALNVEVVRDGGTLVSREVEFFISPNGDEEFYGSTNVLHFDSTKKNDSASIIAIADGIPELDEEFSLHLRSYGPKPASIGPHSVINITVLKNDDSHGVFHFDASKIDQIIGESKNNETESAVFVVQRDRGTFGEVLLQWHAVPRNNSDIEPLSGTVFFENGTSAAEIIVNSVPDQIPERAETFKIVLEPGPSSEIRVEDPAVATLTVRNNDDPIFFTEPIRKITLEDSSVQFLVRRNGSLDEAVSVMVRTADATATESTKDYVPIKDMRLEFPPGIYELPVSVTVLDDEEPETDEFFHVELYGAEGDVVAYGPPASVWIQANDDANGVFRLVPPLVRTVSENDVIEIGVQRFAGNFGAAQVWWHVLDTNGTVLPPATDFSKTSGFVRLKDKETVAYFNLDVLSDGIPEHLEVFQVELFNVTGYGPSGQEGRLADTDLNITIRVLENDDPNGVFAFDSENREQNVAEDYEVGSEHSTVANFSVVRQQGLYGRVQILWEVFSHAIAGELPIVWDLLFLGDAPSTVTKADDYQRFATGTSVYKFFGQPGDYVTVPQQNHPTISEIETGFSITAWVRLQRTTEGYIVAKTSRPGTHHFYTFLLSTLSGDTELTYGYSISDVRLQMLTHHKVTVIVPGEQANITDDKWHQLVLMVDKGQAEFYLDGDFVGVRNLGTTRVVDAPGMLLVGGIAPGDNRYFVGLLQDVRVYSRKLDPGELEELYKMPAKKDVQPVSGYLTFEPSVWSQSIRIQSIQDREDEGDEVFAVKLLSVTGGAKITKNDGVGKLTVLKSDNANGLFGFEGPCRPSAADTEGVVITCTAQRSYGDEGTVTVFWEITQWHPEHLDASQITDFNATTGTLVFRPGEREQVLVLEVMQDQIPEQVEHFHIQLTSAMSDDGQIGTTSNSGASVAMVTSINNITVHENDFPYGLLQFRGVSNDSLMEDTIIRPANYMPQVRVPEEIGELRLVVERAQGVLDDVSVEWRTIDARAVSTGKVPPDIQGASSSLHFLSGQKFAYIDIVINDNERPEGEKDFYVELLNPMHGAQIGAGSKIHVIIEPSDDAYGLFQFADSSVRVIGHELTDDKYTPVILQVSRLGGNIGNATVTWHVMSDPDADILNIAGNLTFVEGQNSADLELRIAGDTIPELDEQFTVRLDSAYPGRLGNPAKITSTVTIAANDDPFGVFTIDSKFRPYLIEEQNTVVPVLVHRGGGDMGLVMVNYTTLLPQEYMRYAYLPPRVVPAGEEDFGMTNGTIIFQPGQREGFFEVKIFDDEIPESAESVFALLTSVTLRNGNKSSLALQSPRIGSSDLAYAQIIINANDNANGLVELAEREVSVSEELVGPVVKAVRRGGNFGQVGVKFRVVPVNASLGLDYSLASEEVIFYDGETEKAVPVIIINDVAPELAEQFIIELTDQVTGGAVVGENNRTVVTIEASDDPRGAFSFEFPYAFAEEPRDGSTNQVPVTIVRTGGTVGVVGVAWTINMTGGATEEDIQPTSGVEYFVTNEARKTFNISVLPDGLPEGPEVFEILLLNATNGGRIMDTNNKFVLTIQANDNPHGSVEFAAGKYLVHEPTTTEHQNITVIRNGGTFGALKVFYSTKEIPLSVLAEKFGKELRDFYSRVHGYAPEGSPVIVDVTQSVKSIEAEDEVTKRATACARICLEEPTCRLFHLNPVTLLCHWYSSDLGPGPGEESTFYLKDHNEVLNLRRSQAQSDIDYEPASLDYIFINDSTTVGHIPISIIPDTLPELREQFHIVLDKVELVGFPPTILQNNPTVGPLSEATVIIDSNDDANGIFRIYSSDPRSLENGARVEVDERDNFAVELMVERAGGNIGEVTVEWSVNKDLTTATINKDYIADGAILNFLPGVNRRMITVGIKNDEERELDEFIVVEISKPGGGASISDQNNVTIVIKANDNVAGLIGLSQPSIMISEGAGVAVNITRTEPALGTVSVDWYISSLGDFKPVLAFRKHNGTVVFEEGQLFKEIQIDVLEDATPEIMEEYELLLRQPRTAGIRESGSAQIDRRQSVTSITVEASNDPHGVIGFATGSLAVRVEELESQNNVVPLTVQRKFGAIGKIRIHYEMKNGSLSTLSNELMMATADQDFVTAKTYIDMADKQSSAIINAIILQDDEPEVDEVFIVELTDVELLDFSEINSQAIPRIDPQASTAQITISANDGTRGVVYFAPESVNVTVNETSARIVLHVHRSQGTFGQVSVFYYSQSLSPNGAKVNRDYSVMAEELVFESGESDKYIRVHIFDDEEAEPDEEFEVILASANNGLILGEPHIATVVIEANDIPAGNVRFESNNTVYLREPTNDDESKSTFDVRLIRGPGHFGSLTVPWNVTVINGTSEIPDIEPSSGFVTFADEEKVVVIQLRAVQDSLPEQEEEFVLQLYPPIGDGGLGNLTEKQIVILENDAPHGLLEIFPADDRSSREVVVEEKAESLYFDVVRSRGSMGSVSVKVATESGTAIGSVGSEVVLSNLQSLTTPAASKLISFEGTSDTFLLVVSNSGHQKVASFTNMRVGGRNESSLSSTVLWKWQGVFVPYQTISTEYAVNAEAFMINGQQYVAVVFHRDSSGSYETSSWIYRVQYNGTLSLMQDFATKGATAVRHFQADGENFLVVVNSRDNYGSSVVNSEVLQWNEAEQLFGAVPIQFLPSKGASDATLQIIDSDVYLVLTNYFDSQWKVYEVDSMVYKWVPRRNQFEIHQRIPTKGARSVTSFRLGGSPVLAIANGKDNSELTELNSTVYRFDPTTRLFVPFQYLPITAAVSVHHFSLSGKIYLAFASATSDSYLYVWSPRDSLFKLLLRSPSAKELLPVTAAIGLMTSQLIVELGWTGTSHVYALSLLEPYSDFVPSQHALVFEEGQTELRVGIGILDDSIPEGSEMFTVSLADPRGGAVVGSRDSVRVKILANDDAYGIVEFSEDSLNVNVDELTIPNQVTLTVLRKRGTSGRVIVTWVASGEHDGINDLSPVNGRVEFGDGQDKTTITLTIGPDTKPELNEVTLITLTDIASTSRNGKGPQIGEKNVARVTVMANDSPHGVVSWARKEVTVSEPFGQGSKINLKVVREQGTMGTIIITYSTRQAIDLPEFKQATSGQDFIAKQGSIAMEEGVTATDVELFLLPDDIPEGNEIFLVDITGVSLAGGIAVGGAVPSVKHPGSETMEVIIGENDNARGVVQFNVTRTPQGVVEVYEGIGVLQLGLVRTGGQYREVSVSWQAIPDTASAQDFRPHSGEVVFADGQKEASVDIEIIDDPLPEYHESFSVQLLEAKGGAELGNDRYVMVTIVKNDSPNGLFSISESEKSVSESETFDDPNGFVMFTVQRTQGSQGIVQVLWKLSPDALDDVRPLSGNLTFKESETLKSITLQTLPDNQLEGEERYALSLVSADNNADISISKGDATVIIHADEGATGIITVDPNFRSVLIGEPFLGYDGTATVRINRGVGRYGEVGVTWQLTPRDPAEFAQVSGTVRFRDMQDSANIILQAVDDDKPEQRQVYSLVLVSVTGGAVVSTTPGTNQATVTMTASDYPHGLFQFAQPPVVRVSEDVPQLSMDVIRGHGTAGQVLVQYSTIDGTASSDEDYRQVSGQLMFSPGNRRQTITVNIRQDEIPEGEETFHVALTSVRLVAPVSNNYTVGPHGFAMDMEPAIGDLFNKTVIIEKNDNAEGMIQFAPDAVNFIVREEAGIARIPLVRYGGQFGRVGVQYRGRSITALPGGIDYLLPLGEVIFPDGIENTTIDVTIIDDIEREVEETFEVLLLETSGGARLGEIRVATVTIAQSDYPFGKIGFVGSTSVTIPNPGSARTLTFTIQRTEGLVGRQTVRWRVLGPNSEWPVDNTNDITYQNSIPHGLMEFADREGGTREIKLMVNPYSGPEVEKVYQIVIYDIQGRPGSAEVSPTAGNVTLTILKHGDPNGIVKFVGSALSHPIVDESRDLPLLLTFPISRRKGTVGNIQVFWEIRGPSGLEPDVEPYSGNVTIPSGERNGKIFVSVLHDDEPELTEVYRLSLTGTKGGAEIDKMDNSTAFTIRPNDDPHGVFGIGNNGQNVIVTQNLKRQVQLNFTREKGKYGAVRVSYDISFDQARAGVGYVPPSGSVSFQNGQDRVLEYIDITNDVQLPFNSSFTVALTDVTYLGSDQTIPPRIDPTMAITKVHVMPEAANSQVGFLHDTILVDEVSNEAIFTIHRWGSYGEVEVTWGSGAPRSQLPVGFAVGVVSPQADHIIMVNGLSSMNISVLLLPQYTQPELFSIQIKAVNARTGSPARVKEDRKLAKIEPHGVIQFERSSLLVSVAEEDGEVRLSVRRAYGSLDNVRIHYQTWSDSASPNVDYISISNGVLMMSEGETSAVIVVNILTDVVPETDEVFYVNITDVELLPTGAYARGSSPRVSTMFSVSKITILGSDDPYGIISFRTKELSLKESNDGTTRRAIVQVQRTGGLNGRVGATVRTIGGDETWQDSPDSALITAALSSISTPRAQANADYLPITQSLVFEPGEQLKTVEVTVLDDPYAEPEEVFFLYLTQPVGGARVAQNTGDTGYKGVSIITIEKSDLWNGVIGFADDSQYATLDEDGNGYVTLNLTRQEAYYGELTVYWRAQMSHTADSRVDSKLTRELIYSAGQTTCESGLPLCSFKVETISDQVPEKAWSFLVFLEGVGEGADIDRLRRFANITVLGNDYPFGLVQFDVDSRFVPMAHDIRRATLLVERTKGNSTAFQVGYITQRIYNPQVVAGIKVYPAIPGGDFIETSGLLSFEPQKKREMIHITLTPEQASANPLPKMFQVVLTNPTNRAVLNKKYSVANVTIVHSMQNIEFWELRSKMVTDLSNAHIMNTLEELQVHLEDTMDINALAIASDIMELILDEGQRRPLPAAVKRIMMNIFCKLMNPNRADTRGQYQLVKLYEKFAYSLLTGQQCNSNWRQQPMYSECRYSKIEVYRQKPSSIAGHTFTALNGDYVKMPETFQLTTAGYTCRDVHFIEYSSPHWFISGEDFLPLVNNRVLSIGVKDEPTRYTASPVIYRVHSPTGVSSKCVYFSMGSGSWLGSEPDGLCTVVEKTSDYVECACRHFSSYALQLMKDVDPRTVAPPTPSYGDIYNVWFFISCFVAVIGFFLAICAHHLCAVYSMFSASLLMHMCFACLATQVVYVIDAYLSTDILADASNNKCIVMGIFLHYFFLAQFTWMGAQALNFWKILVMNDEHTDRKYVMFFLIGWGVPAVIVGVFYAITFNLYRYVFNMDPNYIYGDVSASGSICFIVNVFAALASVVAPVLLLLVFVMAVFTQAYQVLPQWHSYDDVYRGRYNYQEIRVLLIFWSLILVTWIWGGLHMAYGTVWLLIFFCIFNFIQGLYAVVVYAALRHPCLPCFRPLKGGSYAVNLSRAPTSQHVAPSSVDSAKTPLHDIDIVEKMASHTPKGTMRVKRTPATPNNVFILPPNIHPEDNETSDFDDLIFALKTGGQFLPQDITPDKNKNREGSYKSDGLRGSAQRIPIADTHL